jgi:hypothetical protein
MPYTSPPPARPTMTRALLLILLTSCAVAGPAESFVPQPDDLQPTDLVRVDVRGTATSIATIAERIAALPPEQAAEAAESLRILSVNCPYTHVALQLPFALHHVVMGISPADLEPFIQTDWAYLQQGLTTHVAVLHALGVNLSIPRPGDVLYSPDQPQLLRRDTLLSTHDPLSSTSSLIDSLTTLAGQIDEPTKLLIDLHSARVEEVTGIVRTCPRGPWAVLPGHPWTLGIQLGGWHDALRRIEPFIEDPHHAGKIDAMLDLMGRYEAANFASRSTHPQ